MSINERTYIRTIVKWSKPAVIFTVALALLAAYVFVQRAYAQPLVEVSNSLNKTLKEASEIKSNLQTVKSQKSAIEKEAEAKQQKITQLEQENAELKE